MDNTWIKLAGCLVVLLLAYTWAQPFRQIFGLETRNALMAREMLEGGLGLIPTALGHPYPDYPPLYFWLETLFSMPAGHVSPLTAVLPSALAAVWLVALTFLLGRRIGTATGWLAALILATMPSFWLDAGSASIDMLLAFNVAAALTCLYLRDAVRGTWKSPSYTAAAALFMVLAFLTKGPVGIVLTAVAWGGYLLWERRWKQLAAFAAFIFLVGLLCVGLELAIVYHVGGRPLIDDVVRRQVTGRIGQKSNKTFIFYIVCLLEMGAVWWLLIAASGWRARGKKYPFVLPRLAGRHGVLRLALTWTAGILAVFMIASTKKARYLLPLYPALALIIAAWIEELTVNGRLPSRRLVQNIVRGVAATILLAGFAFYWLFPKFRWVPFPTMLIWLAAGIIGWMFVTRRINAQRRCAAALVFLLFVGLSGVNLLATPAVSRNASGQAFVRAAEAGVDPQLPVVVFGINPDGDGIKFALHTTRKPASLRFVRPGGALATIAPPYLLIAKTGDAAEWQKLLPGRTYQWVAGGHIRSHRFAAYLVNAGGPHER